jgi:guanylate kinase
MRRRGVCFVVAAPSGAGKSTITRALLAQEPELFLSVSVTTRAPRVGEREGVHYYYKSEADFARMVAEGALLEHAHVFGRGYGTPKGPIEAALAEGRDVALDIDWQGWRQLRAAMPADSVGVFILPPSMEVLEARLRGRGSDDEAEVSRRMRAAREEISHFSEFDHVLVNDALDVCIARVRAVLGAARCTVARSVGAAELAYSMLGASS